MSENKQRSKNTPEECAVIVKAWAEGKKLQHFYLGEWKDRADQDAELGLGTALYRVKPEPRTFELWASPDGKNIIQYVAPGSEHYYIQSGWTIINVKEIV